MHITYSMLLQEELVPQAEAIRRCYMKVVRLAFKSDAEAVRLPLASVWSWPIITWPSLRTPLPAFPFDTFGNLSPCTWLGLWIADPFGGASPRFTIQLCTFISSDHERPNHMDAHKYGKRKHVWIQHAVAKTCWLPAQLWMICWALTPSATWTSPPWLVKSLSLWAPPRWHWSLFSLPPFHLQLNSHVQLHEYQHWSDS